MVPGHLWILRSGRGRNSSEESVALLADLAFTGSWPGLQGAQGFSGPGTQRLPAFVPNWCCQNYSRGGAPGRGMPESDPNSGLHTRECRTLDSALRQQPPALPLLVPHLLFAWSVSLLIMYAEVPVCEVIFLKK